MGDVVRLKNGKVLVRLRADPTKIRVAFRKAGDEWIVSIETRGMSKRRVRAHNRSPKKALAVALRKAEALGFDGIDLGMGWAYPHPQTRFRG